MRTAIAIILSLTFVFAEDVPLWVMKGMAAVESSSYWTGSEWVYVDRRVGKAGELGMFQMTRAAFNEVKRPGERFEDLRWNTKLAEATAKRYIIKLRANGKRSWRKALAIYNGGAGNPQYGYADKVEAAGPVVVRQLNGTDSLQGCPHFRIGRVGPEKFLDDVGFAAPDPS
jgi:hypothetical protein